MSTLLSTGIGLVEALDTLTEQYKGSFRTSLLMLRQKVTSGISLSEAMAEEPGIYDELTIQMVRVGENSGTLDTVLDRLADFRERYLLFKDRIVTALIYPAIIVTLAIGVSIFLMTVVMPMLLENLLESERMKSELIRQPGILRVGDMPCYFHENTLVADNLPLAEFTVYMGALLLEFQPNRRPGEVVSITARQVNLLMQDGNDNCKERFGKMNMVIFHKLKNQLVLHRQLIQINFYGLQPD
ncbi:MAG: type II secretion system F family protein [Planctomycetaceae bacterium]